MREVKPADRLLEKMERALDVECLDQALDHLQTRFTAVRIFVTRPNPEGDQTFHATRARGDFFSIFGLIDLWCAEQELYPEDFENRKEEE